MAKGQPGMDSRSDGTSPGISASRLPAPSFAPRRGIEFIRPRVYGWRGRSKRSFTAASSTLRPAYITTTRCAYAVERCRVELPPLDAKAPGHTVACWEADRLPPVPT